MMGDGERLTGMVKFFNPEKGFGFITSSAGEDFFVHFSGIDGEGFRSLADAEEVEFAREYDESKGKWHAVRVTGPGGAAVKGSSRAGPKGGGKDFGGGKGKGKGKGKGGKGKFGDYDGGSFGCGGFAGGGHPSGFPGNAYPGGAYPGFPNADYMGGYMGGTYASYPGGMGGGMPGGMAGGMAGGMPGGMVGGIPAGYGSGSYPVNGAFGDGANYPTR